VAHKSLVGGALPISLPLLTSSQFGDMRDRQSEGKESTSETIEWLLTGLQASKRVQNGCMQDRFRDLHTSVLSRRSGSRCGTRSNGDGRTFALKGGMKISEQGRLDLPGLAAKYAGLRSMGE
jgi:hypothetical protein